MYTQYQKKLLSIYKVGDLAVGAEKEISERMNNEDIRIMNDGKFHQKMISIEKEEFCEEHHKLVEICSKCREEIDEHNREEEQILRDIEEGLIPLA